MIKSVWVKRILAAVVLILLFYIVDLQSLWTALAQITVQSVISLLAISVPLIYVSALKWKLFLESSGKGTVSIVHLCRLYLMGYFFNMLIPSYVGGDVARSLYAGKQVGQHQAFAATILERYTGFCAMVALALVFMFFVEAANLQVKMFVLLMAGGLAGLTFFGLSPAAAQYLSRFQFLSAAAGHVNKIQEGFHLARSKPPLLLKALALSLIFHSLTVVNTAVAGAAVGWTDIPFGDLFVVLPLILLIGAIPVTPSGLGIQEGAFFFFLTGIGATPGQAIGVGLVLRAKAYIMALIGWIIWLTLDSKPKEPNEPKER